MNTKENTKWKFLLLFGLGSIVVGLSLLAFGAAAGGIDGIKDNTKAIKEVQTFDNVKKLQVNSMYNVIIESGDVDKVTVTYYTHKKFRPQTIFRQTDDTLSIDQTERNSFVTGFMEMGGYILNEHDVKGDYIETVITIPKDTVLNDLDARLNFHSSTLMNLKTKNINLRGATYVENLTSESGTIQSYSTTITSSHLKNINFDYGIDSFDFRDTTIEDSTFNNFSGYINADHSIFKNVNITAPEVDFRQDEYWESNHYDRYYEDDYYYSSKGHLSLSDTTLENITYKGAGDIKGSGLILKGKIDLSGSLLSTHLRLAEDSRKNTSLDLSTSYGAIVLDGNQSNVSVNGNASSFSQKVDKASSELIIKSQRGYIDIN